MEILIPDHEYKEIAHKLHGCHTLANRLTAFRKQRSKTVSGVDQLIDRSIVDQTELMAALLPYDEKIFSEIVKGDFKFAAALQATVYGFETQLIFRSVYNNGKIELTEEEKLRWAKSSEKALRVLNRDPRHQINRGTLIPILHLSGGQIASVQNVVRNNDAPYLRGVIENPPNETPSEAELNILREKARTSILRVAEITDWIEAKIARIPGPDLKKKAENTYTTAFLHLCQAYRSQIIVEFTQNLPTIENGLLKKRPRRINTLWGMLETEVPWQALILKLREACPEISPELREALEYIVDKPGKIRRLPSHPNTDPVRAILRDLADCTRGETKSELEKKQTLKTIAIGNWDQIQIILSAYLCTRAGQNLDKAYEVIPKWCPELNGDADTLLETIVCRPVEVQGFKTDRQIRNQIEEQKLDEEIKLEEQEAQALAENSQRDLQDLLNKFQQQDELTATAAPAPKVQELKGAYIENWGSEFPKTIEFPLSGSEQELTEILEPIFRRQTSKIPIPTPSVSRAILHYIQEIPAEIKQTMNKETIGGKTWHKIKRCDCRIYIRQETNVCYIHALHRKDWVKNSELEARY